MSIYIYIVIYIYIYIVTEHISYLLWCANVCLCSVQLLLKDDKDDMQRFLWKVSKKQFQTVYYNANTCG